MDKLDTASKQYEAQIKSEIDYSAFSIKARQCCAFENEAISPYKNMNVICLPYFIIV